VFKILGVVAVLVVWNSVRMVLFHHGSRTGAAVETISNTRGAPISSDSAIVVSHKTIGTAVVEQDYGGFYKGEVITILVVN
jgi:hypothetical protein